MKKSLIGSGVVLALALAACATPPSASSSGQPTTSVTPSTYKACMVSDSGGFDDKSFNQTSYKGLTDAKAQLGVQTAEVQSSNDSEYAKNVKSMVDAKCDVIVTVGFKLGDATAAAAKANPKIKFAIVDFAYDKPEANLKGLTFQASEPAFLAGYLAASLTKTQKVGTFGGSKIQTVTIFMAGFADGVSYFNKQKGKNVSVLGWSNTTKDGSFVQSADPFNDVAGGKKAADALMSQGADVLLPVAGPAGEGALQAAKASAGKVASLWVDTDGCISAADYCSVIPSSVGKAMDVSVLQAIKDAKEGTFTNEPYHGTLANNGVYLAPFHEFDSKISAETKAELETIKADIISGKIKPVS